MNRGIGPCGNGGITYTGATHQKIIICIAANSTFIHNPLEPVIIKFIPVFLQNIIPHLINHNSNNQFWFWPEYGYRNKKGADFLLVFQSDEPLVMPVLNPSPTLMSACSLKGGGAFAVAAS